MRRLHRLRSLRTQGDAALKLLNPCHANGRPIRKGPSSTPPWSTFLSCLYPFSHSPACPFLLLCHPTLVLHQYISGIAAPCFHQFQDTAPAPVRTAAFRPGATLQLGFPQESQGESIGRIQDSDELNYTGNSHHKLLRVPLLASPNDDSRSSLA